MTGTSSAAASLTAPAVLASPSTGSDGAGLVAFLVVAALFVACWFLYKSMRRQLGRINVDGSPSQPGEPAPDKADLPPT